MHNVITFHSARDGAGTSMLVANVAALLAAAGQRVGVVDANLPAGSMHTYFGLANASPPYTFNDYLLGVCAGSQATYDVTPRGLQSVAKALQMAQTLHSGRVFLVPASTSARDLRRVQEEGYDIPLITDGLQELAHDLSLDVLLIDTHAGITEEMLLSLLALAIADTVVMVMRLDQGDYQRTGVTVDVLRTLEVPRIHLVVNQIASMIDRADAQQQIAETYACEVLAALPYAEELAAVGSSNIFVVRYPAHPVTALLQRVAEALHNTARSDVPEPSLGA